MRDTEKLLHTCERVLGIDALLASLETKGRAVVEGLKGSAISVLAALLAHERDHSVLVLTHSPERSLQVLGDLTVLCRKTPVELPPVEIDTENGENHPLLTALHRMHTDGAPATAPIQALAWKVPEAVSEMKHAISLRKGTEVEIEKLTERLVEMGFEHTPMVELPGEFAVRGGIVDVFPAVSEYPFRIELYGRRIDSIRRFDPSSQESLEKVEEVVIPPASGSGRKTGMGDALPPDTLLVLEEPLQLMRAWKEFLGWIAPPRGGKHATLEETIGRFSSVTVTGLSGGSDTTIRVPMHDPPHPSAPSAAEAAAVVESCSRRYGRVFVMCDTAAEAEHMESTLVGGKGRGNVSIVPRRLQGGFCTDDGSLCVLATHQLLDRYTHPLPEVSPRRGKEPPPFPSIRKGDAVVHVDHGIGIFEGLRLMKAGEGRTEFMAIRYAGGTVLYVPAVRADRVHRYIGVKGHKVQLSNLKGRDWSARRRAAYRGARSLAAGLLRLYAERAARTRPPYPPDDRLQREFERSFRFTETPDQAAAIEDVKRDMASPRPMERLICGDVGYGKTEIAMRAAFKAVLAGRQVAVLAPTTLLAEQHFRTFRERMADQPVLIEVLSRFVSPSRQRKIIEDLREGKVDIIIGTHRLLQPDVRFKDLGLVIIDEEQRFGVEHKEHFKRHVNPTVDVLMMTATPIPRTLHMALSGIRDISVLKTPVADRTAVRTRLVKFSGKVIRNALLRELNRGGQAFIVGSRIHSLERLMQAATQAVPEARFAVAHGRMPPAQLEETMLAFLDGRVDVLVCTNIIESGLDIPTANTILINDADMFGLADLHQLRGRVGRYRHRGYAYLMVRDPSTLDASRRRKLRMMEETSYLGAGFDISLYDLQVRGAGNVLGPQQHGHIAAVGYTMYCRLLEEAVRHLKGKVSPSAVPAEVNLGLDAYIPPVYIGELQLRMEMYRRIAAVSDVGDARRLLAHLRDRFGPVPEETVNLLREALVGVKLGLLHVESLVRTPKGFAEARLGLENAEAVRLLKDMGFQRRAKGLFGIPGGAPEGMEMLKAIERFLGMEGWHETIVVL